MYTSDNPGPDAISCKVEKIKFKIEKKWKITDNFSFFMIFEVIFYAFINLLVFY